MAQRFWDKAYPLIKETEHHPFLVSMVDGTLKEDNFRYYVIQDTLYLKDFGYCLRRMSEKAAVKTVKAAASQDDDEVYRSQKESERLLEMSIGAETVEMELHKSYLKQWAASASNDDDRKQQQEYRQMPNTLLYTSYMKNIVETRSYGQGLAVLLPCFWVYMHVGKCMLKLRSELDTNNNEQRVRPKHYDDWIDTYAGDEFEKEVTDYIEIVNNELKRIQQKSQSNNDEKSSAAIEKEINDMEEHFMMSCKLEHMFWDQATTMMEWPVIGGL